MADVVSRGTLFDPVLVADLIDKVRGKSSIAKLSASTPIPFNGQKEFIFTMDDEVDLVAENGAKSRGAMALTPVTIVPVKIEYGARLSAEFMYATEEEQIAIIKNFNDGFAKKVARGLDIMAMHGVNPRTGNAATALIGANSFDTGSVPVITIGADANALVEGAIASIQAHDYEASGMAMSPAFRAALAQIIKTDGNPMFPELSWGNAPGSINGLPVDVNNTVSFNSSSDSAILGDFENAFRWGYAKEISTKIIEYGDPDNSGSDLAGHNQVYLRAEMYLGWGILDKNAFAVVQGTGSF